MKPRVYLVIFFLFVPIQAGLLGRLGNYRPDLGLAVLYIIGLLAGPAEAALAGIGIGMLRDIGSAGLLGFSGFTHGLVGLLAGLLGRQVLNIASPTNIVFIVLFSLVENALTSVLLQLVYGSVQFFNALFSRMIPQALLTGLLGILLLRLISRRSVLGWLRRRSSRKEL